MAYRLVGTIDGKPLSLELAPGTNRLGRSSKEADLLVPRDTVSRCHARIDVTGTGLEIRDLESHNHTYVNGVQVANAPIRPGDVIRLADVDLELHEGPAAAPVDPVTPTRAEAQGEPNGRAAPTFRSHSGLDSVRMTWSHLDAAAARPDEGTSLMQALVDLGAFLVRDEPGRDIGAVCLQHLARLFDFRLACILELNETSGEAVILSHSPARLEPELEVSRTMVDMVVRERKTLLVRDVSSDAVTFETAYQKGIRSAMVTPLMQDDEVLGVLYVDHENPVQEFEARHQRLLQLFANLVAAKVASTRTRHEIEWAAFIQSHLVPEPLPHPPGYSVAARLVPSLLIGGDLYEALELPGGRHLYALGDVVGHGVAAAIMMSNVLATLRALAPDATSILALAQRMHELMSAQLAPYGYVTLFLAALDSRTHRLEYVTAGHPPPVLFGPAGDAERLETTGTAIGMPVPVPLSSAAIDLRPGSLLAVWSDGIPEAVRLGVRPVQEFTEERLLARLHDLRQEPLDTILEGIFHESEAFVGRHKAQDDRTMVLLRRDV